MSEQLTMEEFMGGSTSINSFGEQHLACVLLLDTSGSMSGDSIKNLNSAIARFKENVNRDPIARNRVDVAIVSFSTGVEVVSDFMPITDMPTPELDARGRTDMAAGIQTADSILSIIGNSVPQAMDFYDYGWCIDIKLSGHVGCSKSY